MPYTFVHPGFFYPLKQWKPHLFSTTGWIFGSIAPDYAFLLRLTNPRFHLFQYDWKTILFLIFPMALLSAVYFHVVIRNILMDAAPPRLQAQLNHYRNFNFLSHLRKNWFSVSTSILMAILLHLLLDLTVHFDAYTFQHIAWVFYMNYVVGIMYYYLAMYIPAITLSIAGAYFLYRWLFDEGFRIRNITELLTYHSSRKLLISFLVIAAIFGSIKILLTGIESGFAIDTLAIGGTNGMLISFFITPTLFYLRNYFRNNGQQ